MPGTDVDDAVRLIFGELPDFPFLPELPARGAGADLIGRAGAVLAELHVDLQPSGWRLLPGGAGAGLDENRARDLLRRDLDALQVAAVDYTGPLKVQVAGPWTLAAGLELPRGGPALLEAGATRDVAEALGEGLLAHLAEIRTLVPGAELVVQLDEPGLPTVLAGRLPTPSGFSTVPAVEESTAAERLAGLFGQITGSGALGGVHCCAVRPPLAVFREAGASFVSLDATLDLDLDAIGETVEAGVKLILGVVPGQPAGTGEQSGRLSGQASLSDSSRTVEPARRLWRRLGFLPEQLGEVVAVSPTCGMAGASPAYARAVLSGLQAAARLLVDEPE
jgi:hypothetical protein